ncbi:PLP-dependent transferase [Schizopora paradoxa]|uniref:PLP-dependent transferase n=1 Tax=Schizopora paradoxa TaxID=27342 RepID=A0A0H2RVF1_9AGAM|nr:PLP-dependent transferase [Schizopora paradoxa]
MEIQNSTEDEGRTLPPCPPTFGKPMLKYFGLEPGYVNLNSGSYGSPPNYVLEACAKKSKEIEANPDRFMRLAYYSQLRKAREKVASLIGADVDDCVLVTNATLGVNTVLRNLQWNKDDILVFTSVTYGGVERTIKHECDLPHGPRCSSMTINFPTTKDDILSNFESHFKSLRRRQGNKIVVVIDGIVSNPGVLLPWEQMVKICKEEGFVSVVDAAHNIGQQVGINLRMTDPDFWVSNCHKWLYAKRGCAVLYVPKRNQHFIKSSIPTSWSYVSPSDPSGHSEAPNFIEQFNENGTADFAPFLSVIAALEFRDWLGGEDKINSYCHRLALAGGRKLAELLGTSVMDQDGEFTANMANVKLPMDDIPVSAATDSKIMRALFIDWNCYAAHFHHNGSWWVRCSAQIYNEISDFEYLGRALMRICEEIRTDAKKVQ